MRSVTFLIASGMFMLALATSALVVLPFLQLHELKAPRELKPYTAAELRGRQIYISNGCIYCHSQQPRDASFAPDAKRGWGRASVAADYYYDHPHLLGTMRTGPDLFNIGARQPAPTGISATCTSREPTSRRASCRAIRICSTRKTRPTRAIAW